MNEDKLLNKLYKTIPGRCILKILILPSTSKFVGLFMNSKLSKILINKFIKNNNINMNEFEDKKYNSFNDFFTRKKLNIEIDNNKNSFISPCDGYLKVYDINDNSTFIIKKSVYNLESLLQNKELSEEYKNGYCLIFRLTPKEYHRYCYIDAGKKEENIRIKGKLHTVRPVALENYKVFHTNSREYTILKTKNFDDVIQIEVGALLVGKIDNYHDSYTFKKGEEKGKFLYGGSTIILLIKNNEIKVNKKILDNSKKDIETLVKIGEKIGEKYE